MQMAAHAIGADHHDGADRIAGRLVHVGGLRGDAGRHACASAFASTFFSMTFSTVPQSPSSAETSSPLAAIGQFGFFQEAPLAALITSSGCVLQRLEERLPLAGDRRRIALVARIELLDIAGIRSVEERGQLKLLVRFLSCHGVSRTCPSAS